MYAFVVAAAAISFYFLAAACRRPRPAEILASILWAAYSVYESQIANGTLCDANCNIRVDLVLFFPLLGIATYLALQKQPRTGAVAVLAFVCLLLVAWIATLFGNTAVAASAGVVAIVVAVAAIKSRFTAGRT